MTSLREELNQNPDDGLSGSEQIVLNYASVQVGVDAGGTKIEVTLINNKKEVLHSSKVELSANPAKIRKSQAIANLVSAIEQTFKEALASMRNIKNIVIGLAGVDDESSRKEIEQQLLGAFLPMTNPDIQIEVLTDSEIALLSVNEIKALVIIAGTGSIVKGKNREGKIATADGWGDLFGDKGSAVGIGKQALERIFSGHDGRAKEANKLTKAVLDYVGVSEVEKLIPYFYANRETSITKIAEIAKIVYEVAQTGDPVARKILKKAGRDLGRSAVAVVRNLELTNESFSIGLIGSVFQAKEFVIEPLMNEIISVAKNAEFIEPKLKPSVVASIRALENTKYPFLKP